MSAAHVTNAVDEAIKTSLAKSTVSHITIPKDIQEWTESNYKRSPANVPKHSDDRYASSRPLPSENLIRQAATVLNEGWTVAILAGRGCLDARGEILDVAEMLGAPIAKALLGKAVVPDDSSYTTGGIG